MIGLAVYNHYFIPELVVFRKIVGILLSLVLVALLFWPVRYFLQAIWSKQYSLSSIAKRLKYYDKGRLNEITGLSQKELDKWAQTVVLQKVYLEIPLFKKELNKKIPSSIIGWTAVLLVFIIVFSPMSIINEGKTEIFQGTYTRETITLDPLDTTHSVFNTIIELNHPVLTPVYKGNITEALLIKTNESVNWERNGRFYKKQTIICDSIPKLSSWSARIEPPRYLNLSPYTVQDTIKAFLGSKITITFQGVLKDKIWVNVSRETSGVPFIWNGGNIALESSFWAQSIPTLQLNDEPPLITVVGNTSDSLIIKVTDDYGLIRLNIDSQEARIDGLSTVVKISWDNKRSVLFKALDNNNGLRQRELRRPTLTTNQILKNASDQALKSTIVDNKEESLIKYRNNQRSIEKDNEKVDRKELKERSLKRDINEEVEPLDKLLERLDELWRLEEAIELLSKVDSIRNEGLDSALFETAEAIEEFGKEALQPSIESIKNIDKEGRTREEQAKEASDKLKELLATSVAQVQEDNVARIKRLLKSGWAVSIVQENLQELAIAVNKVQSQQLVLVNEKSIKDSLDLLLVNEPKLNQMLNEKRANLHAAMRTIESKMTAGKNIDADVGYATTALNDINQVLYFLLESEKQSLNQAKKDCKNGKPGASGKPAALGEGKEGKKGQPKSSKKPGGRAKGNTGDPKEGKEGNKPGSSGIPGEKELLKRIDAAKEELDQNGQSQGKSREELDRLKEELLFDSTKSGEDLNELEDRLWRVEESVFNKKEQGEQRASESGNNSRSKDSESIDFKVLKSKETDLPLPVLKKR